jgi:hypothetical protein
MDVDVGVDVWPPTDLERRWRGACVAGGGVDVG